MIGIIALFVLSAFLCALFGAGGKFPLWPAVLLLTIVELIQLWPK